MGVKSAWRLQGRQPRHIHVRHFAYTDFCRGSLANTALTCVALSLHIMPYLSEMAEEVGYWILHELFDLKEINFWFVAEMLNFEIFPCRVLQTL